MNNHNHSVMIETLTKDTMVAFVDEIVALDRDYIDEMGPRFCTFPWDRNHYLLDLKGKWALSQLAHSLESDIAGVWVASNTVKDTCHTHRILVSKKYQGRGIAKSMFEHLEKKARQIGLMKMTIEVSCLNETALMFYKKLGFALMKNSEITVYLESRGRSANVFDGCIEEADGSRYYVCRKYIL